jgi:hypothetical protein
MIFMKLKITILSIICVTIIFSCKKVDLTDGVNTTNPANSYVAKLSKVLIDNQSAYEYAYNDSNLVTAEKSKFNYTAYHYNSKGQMTTSDFYGNDDILSSDLVVFQTAMNSPTLLDAASGKKGGTLTYEYNASGLLVKSTYTRPSVTSSEYSEFTYNSSNKISRQTMYWDKVATGYVDYSYDAKGNLVNEALYNLPASGIAELSTTTQYSFDSSPNPYKATSKLLIPGINTNSNNVIKETYTIYIPATQGADKVQVTENAYQYNGMGYPISKNDNILFVYK